MLVAYSVVGTTDAALYQTPESFYCISMDCPHNVDFACVVNTSMGVPLASQRGVNPVLVRVDVGAG